MPTEDPWYSGEYGTAVVEGVQWTGSTASPSGRKYTKINAALKHFFAYHLRTIFVGTTFLSGNVPRGLPYDCEWFLSPDCDIYVR